MRGASILVVDDEPLQLTSVCRILEHAGFRVEGAAGGREALSRLSARRYEFMLLDLLMPDVDGFQVLAELATHEYDTVVVVCSGTDSPQDAARAFRMGAYDFLAKPYSPESLLATLHNALEGRSAKRTLDTLVHSMVGLTGQAFFDKALEELCTWFHADGANIGQVVAVDRIRAISMIIDGERVTDYEYPLAGSPCRGVVAGEVRLYPKNVCGLFPEDRDLQTLKIQGYAGAPVRDQHRRVIGVLWVISRIPLQPPARWSDLLNIIAAKAGAEVERLRAEAALNETNQRFRALVETTQDLVWETTPEGIYTYCSPQTRDILGYAPEELLGRAVFEVMPSREAERLAAFFGELRARQAPFRTMEGTFLTKDGREVTLETGGVPYFDAAGGLQGYRGIAHDITRRKRAEAILRESEEKYRLAMEAARDGLWDWDVPSGRVYYSPSWSRLLGGEAVRDDYSSWEERIHPADRPRLLRTLRAHLEGATGAWQEEHRLRDAQGGWIWVLGRGRVVKRDGKGRPLRMVGTMTDISERKRAEEALQTANALHRNAEEKFSLLLRSAAEAIYGIDRTGACTFVNPACLHVLGYEDEHQLIGRNMHDLTHHTRPDGKRCSRDECPIYQTTRSERGAHADDQLFWRADGSSVPVEYWSYPLRQNGEVVGAVVTFFDITERKRAEAELEHLATHDDLTGLYNRKLLEQRITEELQRSLRYHHPLAVLMLDLDHFKRVNDTFGHQAGDRVLKHMARLLEGSIRNTDYAGRYGGEEFIVVLPETNVSDAEELAERLRQQICDDSFETGDRQVLDITASIGIAVFPDHARSWDELLAAVDTALYAAKRAGRNCVRTAGCPDGPD